MEYLEELAGTFHEDLEIHGDSIEEIVYGEAQSLKDLGRLPAAIGEIEAVLEEGRFAEVTTFFDQWAAVEVYEPGEERRFLERAHFIFVKVRDGRYGYFDSFMEAVGWRAGDLRHWG